MPAQTPRASFLVYIQASGLNCVVSPLSPPLATKLAKYSRTSAPVTTSTVLVSEYALPVSWVSTFAISSFREWRSLTALRRMRERTIGGVWDHDGKAFCADAIAESMSAWEAVWTSARGLAVGG